MCIDAAYYSFDLGRSKNVSGKMAEATECASDQEFEESQFAVLKGQQILSVLSISCESELRVLHEVIFSRDDHLIHNLCSVFRFSLDCSASY